MGPRGVHVNDNADDMLTAYAVKSPLSLPEPIFGSHHESGLDAEYCFDHDGRYGPYETHPDQVPNNNNSTSIDWAKVDWGILQRECATANKDRYPHHPNQDDFAKFYLPTDEAGSTSSPTQQIPPHPASVTKGPQLKNRTAIVLRAWDTMPYTPDHLDTLRSLITECALHTGGEYAIHLLVEIKDPSIDLSHPATYDLTLTKYVPAEFHNLTLLFSGPSLLSAWYPLNDATLGQVRHMDRPLILFSRLHPEFEHLWMVEMDVRYTGHWYNLFENAHAWARKQPRRLSWERANRFFVPAVHRSWKNFSAVIERQTRESGVDEVWGPPPVSPSFPPPHKLQFPTPTVPHPSLDKSSSWGINEDADVLSLSPIARGPMNPSDHSFNIRKGFPFPGLDPPPTYFIDTTVAVRISRRLLAVIHDAQVDWGTDLDAELAPATFAYLVGAKVASFPLPTWFEPIEMGRQGVDEGEVAEMEGVQRMDVGVARGVGGGSEKGKRVEGNVVVGKDGDVTVGHEDSATTQGPEKIMMPHDPNDIQKLFNTQGPERQVWRHPRPKALSAILARMTFAWKLTGFGQFGPEIYGRWVSGGRKREDGGGGGKGKDGERLCLPGVLVHPVKSVEG